MNVNTESWHFKRFKWYFNTLRYWQQREKYGFTWETDPDDMVAENARTSLCQYFWTVVLKVPLKRFGRWVARHGDVIFAVIMAVLVLGMSGLVVVNAGWLPLLFGVVLIVATLGAGLGFAYIMNLKDTGRFENALPVQYIKAKKAKVCPLIEFTEE